jgi:ABC-type transporter Mla MlaB component
VVFSFFKKKGATTSQRPRAIVAKPPPARSPVPEYDVGPHHTVSGIEVSHGGDTGLSRITEEAAILYANGRSDAAMDILLRGISEAGGGRRNPQPWFMLFDLFQLQGMRQEFDKLALDFVVEFERSAPTWQGGGTPREPAASLPARRAHCYVLGGELNGESRRQIADMEEIAGGEGAVRLDFGALRGVDDAGCTLLMEAMERMESLGRRVKLSGADTLQALLHAQIDGRGKSCARSVWLLLLKLYQVRGMHEEFENLSLDYAVAYEVSPPPWEASFAARAAPSSGEFEPGSRAEVPPEALVLSGVVSGANPPQLQELASYAAARSVVNVDLSGVGRVDFVAAGALLNAIMGFSRGGKAVVIHGANEMIQALFAIVGINRHAVIARDRQH